LQRDGQPPAFAYISSLAASYLVQKETGMETIYQITCRDRNRIALLSDMLGAGALGIKNVLALTGDYTTLGDTPQAKPVFDLDSVQLIHMIRKMVDEEVDFNGKPIEFSPKFFVGAGANPNANPIEPELIKFEKKVSAGAEFFQTQVVFEIENTKNFLKETSRYNVPVLIGIFPLRSYGVAEYFDKTVPGVKVPEELLEALAKARDIPDKSKRRAKYDEINLDYFAEFIKELKKTTSASGYHIMSVGYETIIPPLVEAAK
jgi:methylenetetrahydrofolate reductase (NADPH)